VWPKDADQQAEGNRQQKGADHQERQCLVVFVCPFIGKSYLAHPTHVSRIVAGLLARLLGFLGGCCRLLGFAGRLFAGMGLGALAGTPLGFSHGESFVTSSG
jgi:hypothetical protein